MHEINSLIETMAKAADAFRDNPFVQRIDAGKLTRGEYHRLLCGLYHQVRNSPGSFAIAGAMLVGRAKAVSEYLIEHAAEEQLHYQWIETDLQVSGYAGPAIATTLPTHEAVAYIALNYYVAHHAPFSRLAIAGFLEGVSGALGGAYGRKAAELLGLDAKSFRFFLAHGELDKSHSDEVTQVLLAAQLTKDEALLARLHVELAARQYAAIYTAALD